MKIQRLGSRNIVIHFGGAVPTTTYIIIGNERIYLCDTFVGPDPMKKVSEVLMNEGYGNLPILVFNSHADWDHIWGNCFFKDSYIIAHSAGRKRVIEEGEEDLEKWKEHVEGEVVITPPNLVFDSRLYFADDEVEFFHSPGHTLDSSSCYNQKEKILFVGDNVESDIPCVNHLNFDEYISSLQTYIDLEWKAMVPGHDPIQYDNELVRSNIEYLQQFKDWSLDLGNLSERALSVHLYSLIQLVDEILDKGLNDTIRSYYTEALRFAEGLTRDERTQRYVDGISRIVNHP